MPMEDRISYLPDEIIILILSLLTIRQAAITSVLSRRWRNMWKFISKLNFNKENKLGSKRYEPIVKGRMTFMEWVDQVMYHYKGSRIDEFRVCYYLNKTASCYIDQWVSFAIAKGVKSLELNLASNTHFLFYPFPSHFAFERVTSVESMSLIGCALRLPGIGSFKSLTSLHLEYVVLTDEVLEHVVSNCLLLEYLSVKDSEELVNAKVVGSSLRLKFLKIESCDYLKSVEIYAINLVSFKYLGPRICFSFKSSPRLVKVYFALEYQTSDDRLTYICSQLADNSFQLETMILQLRHSEVVMRSEILSVFSKLKVLVLWVWPKEESFTGFISLLKASPLLRRFELHMIWRGPQPEQKKTEIMFECFHQSLEEFELGGFRGYPNDIELLMYMVQNFTTLKKIALDPHDKTVDGSNMSWVFQKHDKIKTARECASHLRQKIPSSIDLVIL